MPKRGERQVAIARITAKAPTPRQLITRLTELGVQLERLQTRNQSESDPIRFESTQRHIDSTRRCIEEAKGQLREITAGRRRN